MFVNLAVELERCISLIFKKVVFVCVLDKLRFFVNAKFHIHGLNMILDCRRKQIQFVGYQFVTTSFVYHFHHTHFSTRYTAIKLGVTDDIGMRASSIYRTIPFSKLKVPFLSTSLVVLSSLPKLHRQNWSTMRYWK